MRSILVGIICFAVGVAVTRYYDSHRLLPPAVETAKAPAENKAEGEFASINFAREPLWAYGFERPPMPGEKAQPQAPPSRNLRPNEDAEEQTKPRRLEGSNATYSLVDVRDGQNVIDWFPKDHPPMPNVIAHGPAALGKNT